MRPIERAQQQAETRIDTKRGRGGTRLSEKLHYDVAPEWAGTPPKHLVDVYFILVVGEEVIEGVPCRAMTRQEREALLDLTCEEGRVLRSYFHGWIVPYRNNN